MSRAASPLSKRSLDILVAGVALVVLAPLLLVLAALVRLKLGTPVLFRQQRIGLDEQPFTLLKFRTMRDTVDAEGKLLPDAERLTPFGALLRRTSFDELPELLNILRGSMSLVGPRPLLPEYLPLYSPRQARRHLVPPGLTGWAQVQGRNATSWAQRLELDVWYVEHRSTLLDLRILCMTFATVLRAKDVNAAGHVTMPRFTGTVGAPQAGDERAPR